MSVKHATAAATPATAIPEENALQALEKKLNAALDAMKGSERTVEEDWNVEDSPSIDPVLRDKCRAVFAKKAAKEAVNQSPPSIFE